ncbi:hypothetical protein DRW07_01770 [Alteromonas sediminis]|uniref:DUF4386 domain-containing protein n=1 Tax=Alteromonas sediminis TaxID=2259342 RepID=A0A3N5Y2X3_9ALTE|nr:hypothetical protein [Alteromonas sediminis]RPJ68162.1 hypothetical protein DRW07_01770 [Alteromonas sediminis]
MQMLKQEKDMRLARVLASLMLAQMVIGILLNFHFLKPLLRYDGSVPAEQLTFVLGCATLLAMFVSSLNVAFGLLMPKAKVKEHQGMFIALIAFASIGVAMSASEYAKLSEYVAFLSSTYSVDPVSSDTTLEHLKQMLATGRNEAHFSAIFVSSISLLFFYGLLYRAAMLPVYLAVFALFSTLFQLVAVGYTFFELSIPTIIQLPLVVTQIAVPVYFFVVGFKSETIDADCQIEQSSQQEAN